MTVAKMGVQDLNFGFVQHVAHALLWSSGGVEGGRDNVLDEYYTWPKLPVIVPPVPSQVIKPIGGCLVNFTSHRRG